MGKIKLFTVTTYDAVKCQEVCAGVFTSNKDALDACATFVYDFAEDNFNEDDFAAIEAARDNTDDMLALFAELRDKPFRYAYGAHYTVDTWVVDVDDAEVFA